MAKKTTAATAVMTAAVTWTQVRLCQARMRVIDPQSVAKAIRRIGSRSGRTAAGRLLLGAACRPIHRRERFITVAGIESAIAMHFSERHSRE